MIALLSLTNAFTFCGESGTPVTFPAGGFCLKSSNIASTIEPGK
ncbi:unannotated protein [freshwater metagenome]|uniref:Unannotated protein n=1 Tax=freshwater metagenome TaxID=449393 RepID=A0A6J7VN74_9ZZZZ